MAEAMTTEPGPSLAGLPPMQRDDYPMLDRLASDISRRGQTRHFFLLGVELGCAIAAAFLVDTSAAVAALILRDASSPYLSAVRVIVIGFGALALLIALLVQIARLAGRAKPDEEWFAGRAVAESTKTSAWRYMMRALPFADSPPTPTASSAPNSTTCCG